MQSAQCYQHGVVERAWPCSRCGTFLCEGCARRTRPTALAMCGECWSLRRAHVATLTRKSGNEAAGILVLGLLSLIPMLVPVQLGTIVVSAVMLRRAQPNPVWPRIALGLAVLGLLVSVVLIFGVGGDGGLQPD